MLSATRWLCICKGEQLLWSLIGAVIHNDTELTFVCGDIFGRISKLSDVIDFDTIPVRNNIDDIVHGHGESLIEFLIDSKMCVLNGRVQLEEVYCFSVCQQAIS